MIESNKSKLDGDNTIILPDQMESGSNTFPFFQLLLLCLVGFTAVMTETMPAGLIPTMANDLHISPGLAGQSISLFAIGAVLAGVPIISLTKHWSRKKVLLMALFGYVIFNTITAMSNHYVLMLTARFLGGTASGVAWGLLAGYAKRLVNPSQTGRALAIVGSSIPLALAFGVPIGTTLGMQFGWKGAFWIVSAFSLVLFFSTLIFMKDFSGIDIKEKSKERGSLGKNKLVTSLFVVLFLWMLTHYSFYTYLSSYLSLYQLDKHIDVFLLLFGCSALLGVFLVGKLIDRWLNFLIGGALILFVISSVILMMGSVSSWFLYAGVIVWGIAFGGVPTLLQKRLSDLVTENLDVAQSIFATVFNLAIAVGSVFGAVVIGYFGPMALPITLIAIGAIKGLLIIRNRRAVTNSTL